MEIDTGVKLFSNLIPILVIGAQLTVIMVIHHISLIGATHHHLNLILKTALQINISCIVLHVFVITITEGTSLSKLISKAVKNCKIIKISGIV